jgi:acyl carrier protein
MSEAEIKAILFDGLREIAPEAEPEKLCPDQKIRETLDIDSFDFLKFLIALNDKTGVEIPEVDYGKLNTLDAMLHYLKSKV